MLCHIAGRASRATLAVRNASSTTACDLWQSIRVMKRPRSAYDQIQGAYYFARMLDKIRLHAQESLHPDYHENLGEGIDGRLCRYLHVSYQDVVKQVLSGLSDDDVWAWCQHNGRGLHEEDVTVWNGFVSKRGWNDAATEALEYYKRQSGLADRTDIQTVFDYYEVDEGRRP